MRVGIHFEEFYPVFVLTRITKENENDSYTVPVQDLPDALFRRYERNMKSWEEIQGEIAKYIADR